VGIDKLCKDCRHVDLDEYFCKHPSTVSKCIVTGGSLYHRCKGERGNYIDSTCRPEGKLFEKREIQGSYGGEI